MEKKNLTELIERDKQNPTIGTMREICRQYPFQRGKAYKLKDIIDRIHEYIKLKTGFTIDKNKIRMRLKKIVKEKDFFESDNTLPDVKGYYKYAGHINEDSTSQPQQEVSNDNFSKNIKAEETHGYGEYRVYAWCLPLYREHSNSEGRYRVKIGMTKSLVGRQQDVQANLPEKQMFLAEFRCSSQSDAQELEKAFHTIFKKWKIKDIPGQEWFLTSKEEIIKTYDRYFAPIPNPVKS